MPVLAAVVETRDPDAALVVRAPGGGARRAAGPSRGPTGPSATRLDRLRQAHGRVGVTLEAGPQRQQPLAPSPGRGRSGHPAASRRARSPTSPATVPRAPARPADQFRTRSSSGRSGDVTGPRRSATAARATPPPPARPRPSRERGPAPRARGPPARRRRPGGRARRPAPRFRAPRQGGQIHGIQCGRSQRGAQRLRPTLRAARSAATSACSSRDTGRWCSAHTRPPRPFRETRADSCPADQRRSRARRRSAGGMADQLAATTALSSVATPRASSIVGASTITRTSCSVPEGRSSTRPVSPRRASAAETACWTVGEEATASLSAPGRSPGPAAGRSRHRRGRRGSCRSGPSGPSGAGRSAARRRWWRARAGPRARTARRRGAKPPARSASSTYRSPTWVVRNEMPCSRIARCRPRLLMTVATSVSSTSSPASCMARARIAMIWSPSTSRPSASTARQRSASPSCAMPRSAPCSPHRRAQRLEVGRADAVVDVEPVRVRVQRDDLRAGARVAVGGGRRRRAVGAVDDHPQPGQRVRGARQQVRHVPRLGVRKIAHAADPGAGRDGLNGAPRPLLDGDPRRRPAACGRRAAKSLMPLSGIGVVRRRDHHAQVRAQRVHEMGDRRGGQHARRRTASGAGGGEPGDHGRLEHLPAGAGVAADHGRPGRWDRSRSASTRAAEAARRRRERARE